MSKFVYDGPLQPAGYVQMTSLATAVALTGLPATGVKMTLIQAEANPIRWRDDGTDPTVAVGSVIDTGQTLVYTGEPSQIRIIETAASAKANVTYYKV